MNLDSLCGNAPLKEQLSEHQQRAGLSHAYIIGGAAGSGKRTLARLLSAAMVCSHSPAEQRPCLDCPGCRKVLAGIHPDVRVIGGDGKDITVSQVRELRADAYVRPNEGARKVYILENAQSMNASAQNAMLKLLEEGPPYAAFLLLSENPAALLQTVRSRCQVLSLTPVTEEEAYSFLSRRYPDKSADVLTAAARNCQGLLGRAVEALERREDGDEDTQARAVQESAALLEHLAKGDELALAEYCVGLERRSREELSALLEQAVGLLRSALAVQAGTACSAAPEVRSAVERCAALSPQALMSAALLLQQLRGSCEFNIGPGHLAGWLCAGLARCR